MLLKEKIDEGFDGQHIEGYALVTNYTKNPTKNGGSYIGGTLECKGTVQFKSWSSSEAFKTLDSDYIANTICYVSGEVNIYGGAKSVILKSIVETDESDVEFSKSDFFASKYNADSYMKSLRQLLAKASDNSIAIFDLVVDKEFREKFMVEFAAAYHHDNCRSGLLAHTTKVARMTSLVTLYPNIIKVVPIDLLYLSAALHDIGKVVEYNNGVVEGAGKYISHTMLGVLKLEEHKEDIIAMVGEHYYTILLSVIQQHHGEYGERPRTVAAYIVHLMDILDTKLTGLDEALLGAESGVVFDEYKLNW